VVVNDRLILGMLVVQALGRLGIEQETLIEKGFHDAARLPYSDVQRKRHLTGLRASCHVIAS